MTTSSKREGQPVDTGGEPAELDLGPVQRGGQPEDQLGERAYHTATLLTDDDGLIVSAPTSGVPEEPNQASSSYPSENPSIRSASMSRAAARVAAVRSRLRGTEFSSPSVSGP